MIKIDNENHNLHLSCWYQHSVTHSVIDWSFRDHTCLLDTFSQLDKPREGESVSTKHQCSYHHGVHGRSGQCLPEPEDRSTGEQPEAPGWSLPDRENLRETLEYSVGDLPGVVAPVLHGPHHHHLDWQDTRDTQQGGQRETSSWNYHGLGFHSGTSGRYRESNCLTFTKSPELRKDLTIKSDFSLQGWIPCDGSHITGGEWKGKTTPNLTGTFLMGRDTVNQASSNQRITFEGKLDQEVQPDKRNESSGFCYHNESLDTGCLNGNRFENHIVVNVSSLSPYLPTYQVVYIIKCWWAEELQLKDMLNRSRFLLT